MEVAVAAAAAAGRALRRAGGKGGGGRGGLGRGWAGAGERGGRPDVSAGGGPAATRARGRCGIRAAPGAAVGMVTPVARTWVAWVWHRQCGFPGTGGRRLTPTLAWWWPPRYEAGAAVYASR